MAEEGAMQAHAVPQDFGLTVGRDPNAVLAEAHRAAKALKDVLDSKPKEDWVIMNGQRYLEYEDWALLAKFYGLTAKVVSTQYIELNGARGFEAKAVAYYIPTGQEVSSAEAMCLNDEDKWSTRARYEWKDGKKNKVGDVPVPLFQLKSMAQTRACAKVLKNVLSWAVVLAGYRPNVAEEMTGDEESGSKKPPVQHPKPKAPESQEPAETLSKVITVESISERDVKKKDGSGTFKAMTVNAEGGWKGDVAGFLPAAKVLQDALQSGVPVKVGFTANQYGNKIGSAEPAPEQE